MVMSQIEVGDLLKVAKKKKRKYYLLFEVPPFTPRPFNGHSTR
jgi:hypothetical protein